MVIADGITAMPITTKYLVAIIRDNPNTDFNKNDGYSYVICNYCGYNGKD